MKFKVTIDSSNVEMCTRLHVAQALEELATRLRRQSAEGVKGMAGIVRDMNGNTVGQWSIKHEEEA